MNATPLLPLSFHRHILKPMGFKDFSVAVAERGRDWLPVNEVAK